MFGFIQNEGVEMPGSCFTLFEIATDERFPMDMRKKVLDIIKMFGKRAGVEDLAEMLSVHFTTIHIQRFPAKFFKTLFWGRVTP